MFADKGVMHLECCLKPKVSIPAITERIID